MRVCDTQWDQLYASVGKQLCVILTTVRYGQIFSDKSTLVRSRPLRSELILTGIDAQGEPGSRLTLMIMSESPDSSSIPQRHSPQFTPAPLPVPTRRPTHRANPSLTDSDDGSQESHNGNNPNLMTHYPYRDADEDPLRYVPLVISTLIHSFLCNLGPYATH